MSRGQSKSTSGKSDHTYTSSRASANIAGSKLNFPLNYGGLGHIFFEQLSNESDKILQVDTIHNITENKGSVKARGIRLAVEMQARGVVANDIILISSKTHAHQTIVLLATLFIGAIVCPVSPEEPYKECLGLVKKLKPKMCFCDTRTISQIDRILHTLNIASEIVNFGTELAGTIQFIKLFPFKEEADFKPIFIDSPHKEVAFIIPTQGTCGDPKLVCLSHHNIYIQAVNFMEIFENPSKIISFFPLSWLTQTIIACTSLEYGVTRIMAASFNERNACKMIHDFVIDLAILGTELAIRMANNVAVRGWNYKATNDVDDRPAGGRAASVSFAVASTGIMAGCLSDTFVFSMAMAMPKPGRSLPLGNEVQRFLYSFPDLYNGKDFDLNCLKNVLVGVVNTSKEDLQHMRKSLPNVKFVQVYSTTETGLVAAVPSSSYSAALEKPASVGRLLKNCKIKVFDIETKQFLGPDKFGELYFKGDGLMLGYFKDIVGTTTALDKGYFKTGDLAKYDEEGWIYHQGRIDDMVYINNELVSPIQLENCILMHPFVHDAVIIGNESELVACIERKPDSKVTAEHILLYISKRMPDYQKIFTRIIFFDELPRTSAGNVIKRQLREELLQVKMEYTRSLASIGTTTALSSINL